MDQQSSPSITAAAAGFDYSTLPTALALRQRKRANRIISLKRRTVETMGEIGQELLTAQTEMEHGTFLQWIEGAAGLSKSTAYRFMDVAKVFGEKLPVLGNLPITVVQRLAERSVPKPVRESVLCRAEAGEMLRPEAILKEVRKAQADKRKSDKATREARRRDKLTPEQRHEEDACKIKAEDERIDRDRQAEAELTSGAMYLIERVGAEDLAAFVELYGNAASGIFSRAVDLAVAQLSQDASLACGDARRQMI